MPDAIGPYTIVREIGRGGMGIVFEGWDERLSRAVAIKTILRTSDPSMRDRLLREARARAGVRRPTPRPRQAPPPPRGAVDARPVRPRGARGGGGQPSQHLSALRHWRA